MGDAAFGFLQALALRPDVIKNTFGLSVPVPLLDALPYILTVVVLAGFVGKAIPPRAGASPMSRSADLLELIPHPRGCGGGNRCGWGDPGLRPRPTPRG